MTIAIYENLTSYTPTSKCPDNGVTNVVWGDGFGANYEQLMNAIATAHDLNLTFCPTPWEKMEHVGKDAISLFSFIGAFNSGPIAKKDTNNISSRFSLSCIDEGSMCRNCRPNHHQILLNLYMSTPKPPLELFRKDRFSIAVHIRRGSDIGATHRRWTSDEEHIACMQYVKDHYKGKALEFHIFSEGEEEMFENIANSVEGEIFLHLDYSLQKSFHHMVMADALIRARSTLSGCASMLQSNEVWAVRHAIQYEEKPCFSI